MLKGPISSDSRAPPSGLKVFPLREWLKRGSPVQPCRENLANQWHSKHSLRGSGLQRLHPELLLRLPCKSSWACFRKHDDSGRRCFSGINRWFLFFPSFFTSPQSLLRTSVHKCYHLFLSLPSWRRKGKVSLLQVPQKEIPSRELCTNMRVIKVGTPNNISVSSQSLREIIRVIFRRVSVSHHDHKWVLPSVHLSSSLMLFYSSELLNEIKSENKLKESWTWWR